MRSIKFHQGFRLDLTRLATLIHTMANGEALSKKAAATAMGVGEPAAEGSIGWLVKTGLGEPREKGYGLTRLGTLIAAHDPDLNHSTTLWLMHYYLVTDHNERAEVWYRAFQEYLSPGTPFTREGLQTYVERSLEIAPTNKSGVSDDCKELFKAYAAAGTLTKLGIIREVEKNRYEAGIPGLLDPHVFAYTLFDAWQRRFPHSDTLRVSQICEEPEFPGKVFVARRDEIVQLLQTLQSLGLVTVVDSQHEPVTRRFRDDPFALLTEYYATL